MRFNILLLMLLPLVTVADDEVVLGEGTIFTGGESNHTHSGACRLKLQRDGNLIVRRRGPFWTVPNDPDPREDSISWTSGHHQVGSYHARLQNDGNLQVIFHGSDAEEVVFSTHVYPFPDNEPAPSHDLLFTDNCILKIQRKFPDGSKDIIWRNIHGWLDNFSADEYPGLDNVMQKGEFFSYPNQNHGTVCGTGANFCMEVPFSLRLQQDCNLVSFVGHDFGDAAAVVWSAGVARPQFDNCYLLVDSNDVALYEGDFDPTLPPNSNRPGKYWSVPQSFFDDAGGFQPGTSTYQILINNAGQMYLDWD